jgi:predicted porin
MKKTIIAMAVAAALPATAQADITLSGSVSAEYTLGSNLVPTTEAELTAESTEVLTNGMTATAEFNVLGDKGQGTIGLEGDFGKVMAGTCAKTLEDVANSAPNDVTKKDDEDACLNGVSYTGEMGGFTVNASKGQFDENHLDDVETAFNVFAQREVMEYITYGAEYDLNGLKVSGESTTEYKASDAAAKAVTKFGTEYAFGDLIISGSKSSNKSSAIVEAAYAKTIGDLAVEVSASSDDDDTWELEATYTMGDIAITAEDGSKITETKISAKYAYNDLSVEVDSDSKVTVGYDLGNADLSIVRERDANKDSSTKVKYTVSF